MAILAAGRRCSNIAQGGGGKGRPAMKHESRGSRDPGRPQVLGGVPIRGNNRLWGRRSGEISPLPIGQFICNTCPVIRLAIRLRCVIC